MKKVIQYATEEKIPDNAVYLYSESEVLEWISLAGEFEEKKKKPIRAWHYFLVEVEESKL